MGEENQQQINFLNTSVVKIGVRKRLASGSSCSSESINEDLEVLKERCYQLKIQERTERGYLEKQLECVINDRREAEKKYENLLKDVGQIEGALVLHTQQGWQI